MAERTGARVVAVSRRGYGLSDKPLPTATCQGYEPATLVTDLRAVLDARAIDRALPGNRLLRLQDANHADCFIEYEAAVLRALENMRW